MGSDYLLALLDLNHVKAIAKTLFLVSMDVAVLLLPQDASCEDQK